MKTQADVFTATMNNFGSALDAYTTAQESAGSATRENAAYMESLQAKITALKGQFQELVLGDGGLTSFVKLLIDAGTTILKFANSDVGQLIIQLGLLITTFSMISKGGNNLLQWFLKLGTSLEMAQGGFSKVAIEAAIANKEFVGLGTATQAVGAKILSMAKAWALSPFGSVAIGVAGILAIVKAIDYVNESFDRNLNKLNELNSAYDSQSKNIEDTEKSLEEVRTKIDEINKLGNLSFTDEQELQNLKEEEAVLENQLRIEQEKLDTQRDQLKLQAQKTLTDEVVVGGKNVGGTSQGSYYQVETATPTEALAKYTQEIQKSQSAIDSYLQEKQKLIDSGVEEGDEIDSLNKKIADEIAIRDEARENASDYADIINDAIKNLDEESDLYKDVQDVLDDYLDTTDDVKDSLEDTGDEADDTASKMYDLGSYSSDAMSSMNDATSDSQQIISDLASEIDNITSAYQAAVNAVYEYNQQGYLSVDTYSQLMQVAPEYLAMMINENGQLYANADAVTTAYQAKVYLMGVEAAEAQVSLAASMAANQGAGAYAALGSQAINTAGSLWELVKARMADKIAAVEDPRDLAALENRINAINDLTQSTIANAKYTTASIKPTNASTGATKKNTGARKKNADATKAQTDALKRQKQALEEEADALEKQIDDYEIVIDYVKDLLKEEQEALEEQKDAELDAIQDKIDALEEEQEAMEENVDAQIDALEKQRDEQEQYWDDQINAIKEANNVLEENMELQRLQEALTSAKSQKVKVLKGGKFVYAEDEEAISKAEQELADYEMQLAVQRQIEELERLKEEALSSLDKQIDELEKYREDQNKNYEQQLKDLQDHYDKVEAEYDVRIKQYDKWLKQFEDMLNASAKRHAQILYNELVGEQGNWDARMKALGTFVQNYEKKKNELDNIKSQIEAIDNRIRALQSEARGIQSNVNGIANGVANKLNGIRALNNEIAKEAAKGYYGYAGSTRVTVKKHSAEEARKELDRIISHRPIEFEGLPTYIKYFAKGTYSVPDDQIALVADPLRPSNRELVVGSKVNKGDGILTSLKKGSGVIPAGRNLTENLVNLARWSQNGGFERTFTTMNQSSSKVVHIENINLPNVQNGEDFVQYLELNFMNDSIQDTNIRE